MEEGSALFDASAYMLFEATGDSEAVYFGAAFDHESDGAAGDDAQSSCDSSEWLHEVVDGGDALIRGDEFDYRSSDDDDDSGDEEDDGVVDQRLRRSLAEPVAREDSSNVNMMNEREGDKLFWEACLAS